MWLWFIVHSLSCVWLFATPWTAAFQASLSFTISWSLLKLMSIESVIPSNHLILWHPLLLLPSIFPRIRIFSNESVLRIKWPKRSEERRVGKEWRQKEKGVAEDEMVGWYHWLNGHEFKQTLEVGDGQGSLACCSLYSYRVRHNWVTEFTYLLNS